MLLKDMLLQENVIKIKNENEELFIFKSGKRSRFFIDVKGASLNPDILEQTTNDIIWSDIPNITAFERIASIAIGGIPIATLLSYRLGIQQVIVRSERHDRGMKSQIIGDCKDKTILLIEDVATTGGSIVNAVKAIRDAGGICNTCMVVVDREEGAKELCKENNIKLYSLLKKSDFGIQEEI